MKDDNYYIIPDEDKDNQPDSYILEEETPSDEENMNDSYALPDEDDSEDDYPDDDSDDDSEIQEEDKPRFNKLSPLKLTMKVLFNPVEGWKSLNRDKSMSPGKLIAYSLVPTSALSAVSVIAEWVYGLRESFKGCIIDGIEIFISYLLSSYCVLLCARILLGRNVGGNLDSRYGRGLIILAMSTLALFASLVSLLPMLEPILVFLPLWTIYSITRGVKYLRLPENRSTIATFVIVALIIGFPILLEWFFRLLE